MRSLVGVVVAFYIIGGTVEKEYPIAGLAGEVVESKRVAQFEKPRKTCGKRFHHVGCGIGSNPSLSKTRPKCNGRGFLVVFRATFLILWTRKLDFLHPAC